MTAHRIPVMACLGLALAMGVPVLAAAEASSPREQARQILAETGVQGGLVEIGDEDVAAEFSEPPGQPLADRADRPGNEDNLTFEVHALLRGLDAVW